MFKFSRGNREAIRNGRVFIPKGNSTRVVEIHIEMSSPAIFNHNWMNRFIGDILSMQFLYVLLVFPQIYPIDVPVYYIVVLFSVLFVIFYAFRKGQINITHSSLLVFITYSIFLSYAFVSKFWSASTDYYLFKIIRLSTINMLIIAYPAILFKNSEDFDRLLRVLTYVSTFIAITLIVGYLSSSYNRPYRLLGTASHIGPSRIVGISLVTTIYYITTLKRGALSYLCAACAVLLTISLIVSGSRGPLVAAIVSTLIFAIYHIVRSQSLKENTIIIGAITSSLLLLPFIHILTRYSIPTIDSIIPILRGDFGEMSGRLDFYQHGFDFWLNSPIIGNGLGSYGILYSGEDTRLYAHNFVLEILSELGIVGLFIFLLVIGISIQSLRVNHSRRRVAVLVFCLFTYSILNASVSFDLPANRVLYLSIGVCVCKNIEVR